MSYIQLRLLCGAWIISHRPNDVMFKWEDRNTRIKVDELVQMGTKIMIHWPMARYALNQGSFISTSCTRSWYRGRRFNRPSHFNSARNYEQLNSNVSKQLTFDQDPAGLTFETSNINNVLSVQFRAIFSMIERTPFSRSTMISKFQ
jgi:hypothetical protein